MFIKSIPLQFCNYRLVERQELWHVACYGIADMLFIRKRISTYMRGSCAVVSFVRRERRAGAIIRKYG